MSRPHCPICGEPLRFDAFTDQWARSKTRYRPSFDTNVAETIARARREMRRAGEDPLDPTTWPSDQQPPEPLGPPRTNRNTTKD